MTENFEKLINNINKLIKAKPFIENTVTGEWKATYGLLTIEEIPRDTDVKYITTMYITSKTNVRLASLCHTEMFDFIKCNYKLGKKK